MLSATSDLLARAQAAIRVTYVILRAGTLHSAMIPARRPLHYPHTRIGFAANRQASVVLLRVQ